VSELCQALDAREGEFLERPLDGAWVYLWLDATYVKVRMGGRVASVAAIIAFWLNLEGRREILGLGTGLSEAKALLCPSGGLRRPRSTRTLPGFIVRR
jgi:transposase-like protein